MEILDCEIEGLKLIFPKIFKDERGFFLESYRESLYRKGGIDVLFVQNNCAFSKKNTLRGMHYQEDPGQDKLVWVSKGMIFDVAVDMRPHSPTFGKWKSVILDEDKKMQFFIPKDFAHGYLALEDSIVHYQASHVYLPEKERSFRYDDPTVGIAWPTVSPLLSERDQNAPFFADVT